LDSSTGIGDATVRQLLDPNTVADNSLWSLTDVTISSCKAVTSASAPVIASNLHKFPKLHTFYLHGTCMTDDETTAIEKLVKKQAEKLNTQ